MSVGCLELSLSVLSSFRIESARHRASLACADRASEAVLPKKRRKRRRGREKKQEVEKKQRPLPCSRCVSSRSIARVFFGLPFPVPSLPLFQNSVCSDRSRTIRILHQLHAEGEAVAGKSRLRSGRCEQKKVKASKERKKERKKERTSRSSTSISLHRPPLRPRSLGPSSLAPSRERTSADQNATNQVQSKPSNSQKPLAFQ